MGKVQKKCMQRNLQHIYVSVTFTIAIYKNRFSKVKIHNFRKFSKESHLSFTFPLTVIVGKNRNEKTTL